MTSLDGLKLFLKKYDQLVESRKANSDICASEFQAIKLQSAEDKKELFALEGAKEPNKKKNRYKDILPFDHSRVILHRDKFVDGSDYINANHIEDNSGKRAYIAAQGPMPHTVDDFWRMIWQFKIKMVIMGCKEVEMGKNRCHRYWPEAGEEAYFHDIKVTLVDTKSYAHNMKLRELKAEKNGTTHILIQLHYMDWPDHGAPETTETILQLIDVLREKHPLDDPPILIHCSAGCGRTGAIIATDIGRKMIKAHQKNIDILSIVSRLRRQRPALVQSKEQYEFIYEVFREIVTQEIQNYESQYSSDYMNINAFPIARAVASAPPQKPEPPPQKPKPPQKPDLPAKYTEYDSQERAYINTPITNVEKCEDLSNELNGNSSYILPSDEKRQIILPKEHAVNTDSGFIRRSRSAYGKKGKPTETKSAPPEVPMKESKNLLRSQEKLDEKGPVLPPKSPGSKNKQKFFNSSANRQSSHSVKVKSNVPPAKPKLLKKPSIDSFILSQSKKDPDYVQLETCDFVTPKEDFIPAPTPVGFNQYPMRSTMSHSSSQPMLPTKPAVISIDLTTKISSSDSQLNNEENKNKLYEQLKPGKPANQLHPSHPHTDSWAVNLSSNKLFYSPEEVTQTNISNPSSNIFGSASSSFDTSVVKNINIGELSNRRRMDDEYAVIDKNKKSNIINKESGNMKVKVGHSEVQNQSGIYETISGEPDITPPSNNFVGTYMQVDKITNNKMSAIQGLKTDLHLEKSKAEPSIKPYTVTEVGVGYKKQLDLAHEQERQNPEVLSKQSEPSIKPYTVTEVGVGYKKQLDLAHEQERLNSNKEMQHTSVATKQDGPPLPIRKGPSVPPSTHDEGEYSEIYSSPYELEVQQGKQMTPTGGINWFNDKMKNIAKRVSSNPTVASEVIWTHSFDIDDKFGFPTRINAKPTGPRPPPPWKEIPTP